MSEHIEQVNILTDAIERDAATLFNRIGEIREGLKYGEVQGCLERLKDYQQDAVAIVLNLKEMQTHVEALGEE